jgi:hypothetical protein
MMIRAWMRTAIREEVASFGTLLSTLCHEFCHHLDLQKFGFRDSWHTRGFYERAGALYHYARDTAPKRPVAGGRTQPSSHRSLLRSTAGLEFAGQQIRLMLAGVLSAASGHCYATKRVSSTMRLRLGIGRFHSLYSNLAE